jgi:hypothetical protein
MYRVDCKWGPPEEMLCEGTSAFVIVTCSFTIVSSLTIILSEAEEIVRSIEIR